MVSPICRRQGPNGAVYNWTNGMVYVANNDDNSVSVIYSQSNAVVKTITVGKPTPAFGPGSTDSTSTRIYVAQLLATRRRDRRTRHSDRPNRSATSHHFIASPRADRVYVTNHGSSSVTVIRASDNTGSRHHCAAGSGRPVWYHYRHPINRVYVATIADGRLLRSDRAS